MTASASGLWLPNWISTLVLDLDADKVAGVDGTAVATWANQAPTGSINDFTQATGSKQPLIKRNIINGRSAILYDGVDDALTSSVVIAAGAYSQYTVFKMTATPGVSGSYGLERMLASATPAAGLIALLNVAGYQPYTIMAKATTTNGLSVGIADALDTNAHLIGVRYNNGTNTATGSYSCSLDGTAKTVVASGLVGITAGSVGCVGSVVVSGVSSSVLVGYVARVLVFSTNLSTADDAAVVKYLRNIYGV